MDVESAYNPPQIRTLSYNQQIAIYGFLYIDFNGAFITPFYSIIHVWKFSFSDQYFFRISKQYILFH